MRFEDQPYIGLPGETMVRKGLADHASGRETIESLLIQIGATRLRRSGVGVEKNVNPDADYKLYELLGKLNGRRAYSQYNAWIRQLVSFERALENRRARHRRQTQAFPA
jgi:hypothetical protein